MILAVQKIRFSGRPSVGETVQGGLPQYAADHETGGGLL